MGQDTMLFAYALATTASGLLARGGDPLGHSAGHRFRTGHVGTGIEGLRFLLGPATQVRPQP